MFQSQKSHVVIVRLKNRLSLSLWSGPPKAQFLFLMWDRKIEIRKEIKGIHLNKQIGAFGSIIFANISILASNSTFWSFWN